MKTLRTVIYSLTLKQTSLTLKERSMARQNKTETGKKDKTWPINRFTHTHEKSSFAAHRCL